MKVQTMKGMRFRAKKTTNKKLQSSPFVFSLRFRQKKVCEGFTRGKTCERFQKRKCV